MTTAAGGIPPTTPAPGPVPGTVMTPGYARAVERLRIAMARQ